MLGESTRPTAKRAIYAINKRYARKVTACQSERYQNAGRTLVAEKGEKKNLFQVIDNEDVF